MNFDKPIGPLIDDQTTGMILSPPGRRRGRWVHARNVLEDPNALCGANVLKGFGDLGIDLIPESEWDDRIDEIERNKCDIPTISNEIGLPCLDQNGTNYCWVNAPTHCCEIIRAIETGRVWSFSPASAGGPIKGFRNVGGWGSQALEYFKQNGLNETKDWPDNAINRSYYTDANRQEAKRHGVLEYYVLRSWQERVSVILHGIPLADGYNWWSHEVTGVHVLKRSHDLVIRNSWGMGWGDKGFSTLSGSRKMANDSVAIVAMKPAGGPPK